MVKVSDGHVVSVYKLSDGHRIAVFLSFLYALHEKESVFLIDAPEAFVHPDGLRVVPDFISGLADMGNQVVVATQSIEFLKRLLGSAEVKRFCLIVFSLKKLSCLGMDAYHRCVSEGVKLA